MGADLDGRGDRRRRERDQRGIINDGQGVSGGSLEGRGGRGARIEGNSKVDGRQSEWSHYGEDNQRDQNDSWDNHWNDSRGSGDCCWAYIDPKNHVQVGFTTEEMREWFKRG